MTLLDTLTAHYGETGPSCQSAETLRDMLVVLLERRAQLSEELLSTMRHIERVESEIEKQKRKEHPMQQQNQRTSEIKQKLFGKELTDRAEQTGKAAGLETFIENILSGLTEKQIEALIISAAPMLSGLIYSTIHTDKTDGE